MYSYIFCVHHLKAITLSCLSWLKVNRINLLILLKRFVLQLQPSQPVMLLLLLQVTGLTEEEEKERRRRQQERVSGSCDLCFRGMGWLAGLVMIGLGYIEVLLLQTVRVLSFVEEISSYHMLRFSTNHQLLIFYLSSIIDLPTTNDSSNCIHCLFMFDI